MKKVVIFTFVAGALALASCSKTHVCECTVLGFTADTTLEMSKSDAKTYCDNQNTASAIFGGSCELK
jgi:hypothetical protein